MTVAHIYTVAFQGIAVLGSKLPKPPHDGLSAKNDLKSQVF